MDIYLGNNSNRFSNYFLPMANLEVQNLLSAVYAVSAFNIKDGLTRLRFQNEVKNFAQSQLDAIRSASSESLCREYLNNLRQETSYLMIQDRMLQTGQAALHATIELVKNNNVWGYVIKGVGIVLSGLQIAAGIGVGFSSIATGNVVGAAFGAMLALHGLNSMQENVDNLIRDRDDSQGFLKNGYVATAKFLGFDQKVGEIAYSGMDLTLSAYGMVKLSLKPDAWRLFRYINVDYLRNINLMTRTELAIEVYNNTMTIKSMYEMTRE